jgi:hypothetical protein
MSDVPLPEPDFYCAPKSGKILSVQGYERGDHLQGLMRGHYEPVYYGHKLDAHAAAVSADLREQNARLREALEKIAKSSPDEFGCYYANRRNIGISIAALKGASHE